MKDIIRNNKALLVVLSGAIIIMLLIIVPFMIFREKNEKAKDKYFPNYTKIKVDKKTEKDIYDHLEKCANVNGYIKALIKADIER